MRIFVFLLMLLFFLAAGAQEDSANKSLEEVVVIAQRIEQKEIWIPYSVKKISGKFFKERSPRTTPEALQGMNGVFVQKTNHGGGSAFIRGLTGNQTLILIDGIRLNNSTFRYGPNQYLNTIDPYIIERIEVAKGTGSVQYGTDALGGVIHVISKEPVFAEGKSTWHGKALAKYMTGNMEKTARGELSYASNKMAFIGGVTYRDFGDLVGGDTTGKQTPSGYSEWAFNAKAKFLLQKKIMLTLSHQNVDQQHIPVYHKIILENFALNEFDKQQRQLQYARLDIESNSKWIKKLEIIASRQQSIEGRESQKKGNTTLRKERDKTNTIGLTADVFSELSKAWAANTGVEFYKDKINSNRKDINTQNGLVSNKRGLYPDNSKYGNYSLYSLHHLKHKNWVADAGLRFNTFSIRLTDTSIGKVKVNPSPLVWNAALMYRIFQQHHIYLTYSTGYRAPNIDDMGSLGIVDFRFEVPTNNLRSERSANLELGYKFSTSKLKGDVAFYHMQLSDLITRIKVDGEIINGYQVYRKENIEDAFIKGVESELTWKIMETIDINGSITYTYGVNKTRSEPLRRIPPLHGRVLSTFRKKNWFTATEFLFAAKQNQLAQGDREDNRIPAGGTPGWKVVNLYAGNQWSCFHFNVGLQNIFNQDYRTHGSGINGVGRSAWLSASLNF
jgi:outer membrane receptor protein involved in Fe transport